jgi:DNA-binding MarR family transcriptional regulator
MQTENADIAPPNRRTAASSSHRQVHLYDLYLFVATNIVSTDICFGSVCLIDLPNNVRAALGIIRTGDLLLTEIERVLRPFRITLPQYSTLRHLEGAPKDGMTCGQLIEEMLARAPDLTRHLDRLEERGLISRSRSLRDRRAVFVRITPAGRKLLAKVHPVAEAGRGALLNWMEPKRIALLLKTMEEIESRHAHGVGT